MELIALVVAAAALVLALLALARTGRATKSSGDDAAREARRIAGNVEAGLRAELDITRRLLVQLARGTSLTPEAILEGQLWRDVDGAAARALVDGGGVVIVDVRTPAETRAGVLPGARLIPMDELDERKGEIPRDGQVLVYCAMGGRSAAACDALAREGWDGLMNLTGGVGAWPGPLARP